MWITCNECSGKGTEITISFDKTHPCKIYKTVPCKVCNPLKLAILFDENVRGQIWVDDNYEPIILQGLSSMSLVFKDQNE